MLKYTRQLFRLMYINYVLLKHGFDEIVLATPIFRPLKFLLLFSLSRWTNRYVSYGERIRKACEELGPIFVKFGQLLSTRLDVMPDDIAKELIKLQDRVPPFCSETAKNIIEKSLGNSIETFFSSFDPTPLASASIAQVHAATLLNGKKVVVKVLRPNIKKHLQRDIELLEILAKLTEKYWKDSRQFRPISIVAELKKSIFDELDLTREAANASQLRRNFNDDKLLYVPESSLVFN